MSHPLAAFVPRIAAPTGLMRLLARIGEARRALARHRARKRTRAELARLPAHLRADIGLGPSELALFDARLDWRGGSVGDRREG